MSYTPDDQLLSDPIRNVISSMDVLMDRMSNRICATGYSDDWKPSHKMELLELKQDMEKMKFRLVKLSSETR